jgi:hypothetical protein
MWFCVLSILLAMLVILVLAGVVVLYVAYPHRGEEMPHTPWVGEAMRKGVDRLPTLDNQRENQHDHPHQHQPQ